MAEKKQESLQKTEGRHTPEPVRERPYVVPRVDIYENDKEVLLIADVPGVDREHLRIHLDKDELYLEGIRREERVGEALGTEFGLADYRRTFLVPQGLDGNRISAELRNGVLSLHLPKAEEARPRQIKIKAG